MVATVTFSLTFLYQIVRHSVEARENKSDISVFCWEKEGGSDTCGHFYVLNTKGMQWCEINVDKKLKLFKQQVKSAAGFWEKEQMNFI